MLQFLRSSRADISKCHECTSIDPRERACIAMRLHTQLWLQFAPWLDWCREQLATTHAHGKHAQLPGASSKPRRGSSRVTLRLFLVALLAVVLLIQLITRVDVIHAPFRPSSLAYCGQHPISQLTANAQQSFAAVKARQSKTLVEAVAEYRRRYGMPPPPHFDKWYEFAQSRGTVLVDEYDSIYHSMLPFWALSPRTIRTRTRNDLGFQENQLMGVSIRKGEAIHMGNNNGQGDFQARGTMEMLGPFAQWLPDMDIAFNVHDEPRVVLSRDELDWMVGAGREAQAELGWRGINVDREFSPSHKEFDGPIPENRKTRFSNTDHQDTWLWSRLSCPVDSPARRLDDGEEDYEDAPVYADGPLGLVSNHTAFSDICESPVLRHRLGFFSQPNACKITTQLTPVFSMSKPSTFQDIPYPSPFYHAHPEPFDENMSVEWDKMLPQIYWRGGTSGGYTDGGAWRTQLRQHVITQLTKSAPNENQQVLLDREDPVPMTCKVRGLESWRYHLDQEQDRPKHNHTFSQLHGETGTYSNQTLNLKFTLVNQCAELDCIEELAFFGQADPDPQDDAWKYRYLLDMDGNAYSGRFYAFMLSDSVPFKLAFFREWHGDSLVPWVHYVPLSLHTRGYVELVRFFEEEEQGRILAKQIAQESKQWAKSSLRNADMEVYMFRLLLE